MTFHRLGPSYSHTMPRSIPIRIHRHPVLAARLAAALTLVTCLPLSAQTPASKPSAAIPATQPTIAQPPIPAALPQPAQHRAEIVFSNGQITVSANNSSLNQILFDIAHQTGMKITGGVNDERVFGHYGPATPASILTRLLDGTGSNMLLVSTPGHDSAPTELILTPRHGGPTPPNPNAIFAEQREQEQAEQERERLEAAHPAPTTPPPAQAAQPPAATANPAAATTGTDPAAATTDQQSPNGVKTPQQIFEQLQKMRQQQQSGTTPQ